MASSPADTTMKVVRCIDCALAAYQRGPAGRPLRGKAGRCKAAMPEITVHAPCFAKGAHTFNYGDEKKGIWPDTKGPCDFFVPIANANGTGGVS